MGPESTGQHSLGLRGLGAWEEAGGPWPALARRSRGTGMLEVPGQHFLGSLGAWEYWPALPRTELVSCRYLASTS